jgi:twitching motility protein PilT
MELEDLFREMLERNSSDLHLKANRPPLMRIHGELLPTDHEPLVPDEVRRLVYSILRDRDIERFEQDQELDAAHTFEDKARFRINLFYQREQLGAVMRLIPLEIPTVDELALPPVLKELALRQQGMLLFTGPTGCGKSTSMAAMIHHINQNQQRHIVTIEDPIEFVHKDNKSTINQRELGTDTKTLGEALRHVLRQDPDVVLIGEMRDPETIETAIQAAETGHLVFSTLHTNDAKQTMDRILESFEGNHQKRIRTLLALTLLAVLSQRLIMRADGSGRIAALEIMINSPNISHLLEKGQTHALDEAIAKGSTYWHMQTFNQALCRLVGDRLITPESAMENSTNPGDLRLMLRGVGIGSAEIDKLAEKLIATPTAEGQSSSDVQEEPGEREGRATTGREFRL